MLASARKRGITFVACAPIAEPCCVASCVPAAKTLQTALMKPLLRRGLLTFVLVCAAAWPLRAQEILVGQYASLTGSEATFGINSANGVALALEEVNKTGV